MTRVPVIDNGGQWTHREWRVLRELGAECEILPNDAPAGLLEGADGVVLSGGALSLEGTDALGRVGDWIDAFPGPVLGICVGHQYLARHYGGTVRKAASPEFGRARIELDPEPGPLFEGLG
ncbi:MAG: glutamine amidotransferase-related protein, partial [Thermoplasmata archaeon]